MERLTYQLRSIRKAAATHFPIPGADLAPAESRRDVRMIWVGIRISDWRNVLTDVLGIMNTPKYRKSQEDFVFQQLLNAGSTRG